MKNLKIALAIQILAILSVHALFASELPIIGEKENATWEIFTNRSNARDLLISDDESILWIATDGGLEKRDTSTGRLMQVLTNLDGLPENDIQSILSDNVGGLWIGTWGGGLANMRADGTWILFNTTNSNLPSNFVSSLLYDNGGELWVGTSDGLAHLKSDGTWQIFNQDNSDLPTNTIDTMDSDGKGGLWIGTGSLIGEGLVHFKSNGKWEIFNSDNSKLPENDINTLLSDGAGGVWIGTPESGLAHFKSDGKWEIFKQYDSSGLPENSITKLLSDGNGGLWIGTPQSGLVHFKSDLTWQTFNSSNSDLPLDWVSSLLSDGNGGIWIGTGSESNAAVVHFKDDGTWSVFKSDNSGLTDNNVSSFLSDGKGGIWIGTGSIFYSALFHFKSDGRWEKFNKDNSGMPHNIGIQALASDGSSGVWIGTDGGGVARFKSDGTWQTFNKDNSGLPDNDIPALLSDGKGGVWIGTGDSDYGGGAGLAHLKSDGKWQIFNTDNSQLPNNHVTALASDGKGGVWIGTGSSDYGDDSSGLAHLKSDGKWEIFDEYNSRLPDSYITSLLSDGNGGVWIGTRYGGLAKLNSDKTWELFETDTYGLTGYWSANALISDGNEGVWVGTDSFGLLHLKSDRSWESFTGLTDNHIRSLLSDEQGGMWIGMYSGGLAHLSFSQKQVVSESIKDETDKIEVLNGTRAAIIIAAGSSSPKDNKFWYSTDYLTSRLIYKAFYDRGYDHSEIYYLSPKSWADFNLDGRGDNIVDAPVTSIEFGEGIKERDLTLDDIDRAFEWAKNIGKLSQPFYLYFVDHGEEGKLMLTKFDAITGERLNSIISDYQESTGNKVVVIIEACYSGSLIPYLSGDGRVIITSSGALEKSYYDQNGDVSFTSAFLMNISGSNLKDALSYAKETMRAEFSIPQVTPLLDDNGDGVADDLDGEILANRIGINGTWGEQASEIAVEAVGANRSVQVGSSLTLEARVHSSGVIKQVLGVVRSPYPQVVYDELGTPMMQNPTFTLNDIDGDGIYAGSFSGFSCAGDYQITFFAKDYSNNIDASSAITVTVTGGESCSPEDGESSFKATTGVFVSKQLYSQGETIEVQVKNQGTGFYDQYSAVVYPDGTLYCITSMNHLTTDIVKWAD
ncbi:MAG: hypothetical protein HQK68_13010, partial [Desulfamplus sp.]|nr:hypothetical protein [Desulfamplus sp.]